MAEVWVGEREGPERRGVVSGKVDYNFNQFLWYAGSRSRSVAAVNVSLPEGVEVVNGGHFLWKKNAEVSPLLYVTYTKLFGIIYDRNGSEHVCQIQRD